MLETFFVERRSCPKEVINLIMFVDARRSRGLNTAEKVGVGPRLPFTIVRLGGNVAACHRGVIPANTTSNHGLNLNLHTRRKQVAYRTNLIER